MQFRCSQFMREGKTEQLFQEKQMLHMRIDCFVESVVDGDAVTVVVVVVGHFAVSCIGVFVLVPVSMDSLLRVFFDDRNIVRKLN